MAKRKVKPNPHILILNPGTDKAEVWRKLVRRYGISKGAEEYYKLFPKSSRRVRRNKGQSALIKKLEKRKDFKDALKQYRKFHGKDPDEILELDVPGMKEGTIVSVMGEAPAVSYDTNDVVPGSSKSGSTWVHPFENKEGERPLVVVTSDGKTIMYLPVNAKGKSSGFKVTNWVKG